jgi:hypothetical protein
MTMKPAAVSCSPSAVSSTSDEVSPWCTQRPASPTDPATTSTNAATSWSVTFSRSFTASTVNEARSRISAASSDDTTPSCSSASIAASSTSSQVSSFRCSDQTAPISGRV